MEVRHSRIEMTTPAKQVHSLYLNQSVLMCFDFLRVRERWPGY